MSSKFCPPRVYGTKESSTISSALPDKIFTGKLVYHFRRKSVSNVSHGYFKPYGSADLGHHQLVQINRKKFGKKYNEKKVDCEIRKTSVKTEEH